MRSILLSVSALLFLAGCYSGNSLRVTRGKNFQRERGYVYINPIRMTEVGSSEILLDLKKLQNSETAFNYCKDSVQEDSNIYNHIARILAASAGKTIGDTSTPTNSAAAFDAGTTPGTNSTKVSYSDLIELIANSQMLANSLVRRFSNIKAPSSEHKIYCIPVDITFLPGTITRQNYRVDIKLKFNDKNGDAKGFKIFAVAPYEYSKISSIMQTQLKELFITAAAKGTVYGVDVEGRFDKVMRNFNRLQRTLSRPEISAMLLEDDTILLTYWGNHDFDGDSNLMSGETFRCELFAYYSPQIYMEQFFNSDIGDKNVDMEAITYDYIWQYTPTQGYRWFNPGNWFRGFPPELSKMEFVKQIRERGSFNWWFTGVVGTTIRESCREPGNLRLDDWQNYCYCSVGNPLWIDNLLINPDPVKIENVYLTDELDTDNKNIKVKTDRLATSCKAVEKAQDDYDKAKKAVDDARTALEKYGNPSPETSSNATRAKTAAAKVPQENTENTLNSYREQLAAATRALTAATNNLNKAKSNKGKAEEALSLAEKTETKKKILSIAERVSASAARSERNLWFVNCPQDDQIVTCIYNIIVKLSHKYTANNSSDKILQAGIDVAFKVALAKISPPVPKVYPGYVNGNYALFTKSVFLTEQTKNSFILLLERLKHYLEFNKKLANPILLITGLSVELTNFLDSNSAIELAADLAGALDANNALQLAARLTVELAKSKTQAAKKYSKTGKEQNGQEIENMIDNVTTRAMKAEEAAASIARYTGIDYRIARCLAAKSENAGKNAKIKKQMRTPLKNDAETRRKVAKIIQVLAEAVKRTRKFPDKITDSLIESAQKAQSIAASPTETRTIFAPNQKDMDYKADVFVKAFKEQISAAKIVEEAKALNCSCQQSVMIKGSGFGMPVKIAVANSEKLGVLKLKAYFNGYELFTGASRANANTVIAGVPQEVGISAGQIGILKICKERIIPGNTTPKITLLLAQNVEIKTLKADSARSSESKKNKTVTITVTSPDSTSGSTVTNKTTVNTATTVDTAAKL